MKGGTYPWLNHGSQTRPRNRGGLRPRRSQKPYQSHSSKSGAVR
jgi:hypothetical protein